MASRLRDGQSSLNSALSRCSSQKRGPERCNAVKCAFVDHKGNKQRVWLALDADARQIVSAYVGNRSAESA